MKEILEFIKKRFPVDNNWSQGNCFYFALILKNRFNGDMYYDVIQGHFITKIDDKFYDYDGVFSEEEKPTFIKWDEFQLYDNKQFERIIRDCIK